MMANSHDGYVNLVIAIKGTRRMETWFSRHFCFVFKSGRDINEGKTYRRSTFPDVNPCGTTPNKNLKPANIATILLLINLYLINNRLRVKFNIENPYRDDRLTLINLDRVH